MEITEIHSIDVRAPEAVEIQLARDGETWKIWVNVDGICLLRAQKVGTLIIAGDSPDLSVQRC